MWRNNGKGGNKSATSFSTNATPQGQKSPPRFPWCPFCNSYNHDLDNCPIFAKKAIEERRLFVQEARLCFGCLCLGHVSKRCRNRKVCKSCSMPHPTVLHDVTKSTLKVNEGSASKEVARVAQLEEATSSCTNTCNATRAIDAITNSMIVPVRVHHRTNPKRQVVVYALLDPASNGTFIKESILEDLPVDGTETQLQLNTMHGSEVVPTRRITGLNVKSMGKDPAWNCTKHIQEMTYRRRE